MKSRFTLNAGWTHHLLRSAAVLAVAASGAVNAADETERQYCERQEGIAKTVCLRDLGKNADKSAAAATPAPAATPVAADDADRQYCERQEGIAKTVCLRDLGKTAAKPAAAAPTANASSPAMPAVATAAPTAPGAAPYKVVDGYHVDPQTLKGFQTWRAAACDRCHGPNQEGLVGPSLVNSLKVLTKDDFVKTVTNGRLEKGMPSFSTNTQVIGNIDQLYAYLKGRSDGAITKAHVEPMQ